MMIADGKGASTKVSCSCLWAALGKGSMNDDPFGKSLLYFDY
jgi:hypothetical protein